MTVNASDDRTIATSRARGARAYLTTRHAWAAMRLTIGWLFLWTFADELLGLGFATEVGWIDGGSPTFNLLAVSSHGLLEDIYVRPAGDAVVDALYMAAIGGAGLALLLGIGVRIAAAIGAAVHIVLWSTYLPPVSNPFIDEHIFQAVALIGIAIADAGATWGLGARWQRLELVRRNPVLK